MFQTVFCATAATIVSGSMAERTKFSAYCCYSAAISLIVYPISGHWIWGGGWLAQLGFHDFAGSTAVHFVGGVAACLGAWMLGPRIGKYNKDGHAARHPRPQPDRHGAGRFHPVVLLVRLQRRLHRFSMTGDDTIDFRRSYLLQHQPGRRAGYRCGADRLLGAGTASPMYL